MLFERMFQESIYVIPSIAPCQNLEGHQEPPLQHSSSNGLKFYAPRLLTQLPNTQPSSNSSPYIIPKVRQCGRPLGQIQVKKRSRSQSVGGPFRCESCDRDFTRKGDMERHTFRTKIHGNTKMYGCGTCSSRFLRVDTLKVSSHLIWVLTNGQRHEENVHLNFGVSQGQEGLTLGKNMTVALKGRVNEPGSRTLCLSPLRTCTIH